ncbi:hypothetical protein SLEP1_g49094 [Rubroshorea leprosula]|uniref:Uncharacterized protein n=1 Tax=Rubroshorea leprosula TaxID=152421 RepID=A0AAV5LVT6_9ROSI|nr:hypothetical protein SLEP1_g49094 [Rubroshorea leprosula]
MQFPFCRVASHVVNLNMINETGNSTAALVVNTWVERGNRKQTQECDNHDN